MNSRERFEARLKGEPVDRLPALPIFMVYACDLIGETYDRFCRDHRVMVAGNLALVERYGIDVVSCCSYPFAETHDCGAELEYFDRQPPACRHHLLQSPEDFAKLQKPDPHGGGHMTERLKAIRRYRQEVGDEIPIQGWVEGPMAQAADLRGINEVMMETITEPEFMEDLMDWVVEMEIEFALAQIEAGANLIGVGDAAASLVSPQYYADEVAPREKRIVEAIQGAGARVRLHICGNIQRKYDAIAGLGVDFLDIDYPQTVAEVREGVGPGLVLAGNVDPVRGIQDSTPEKIRAAFAECHRQAGERFLLAAGCEVPPDTPEENVRAMFEYAQSVT
jgi:MtaA/CmuA family methyltransferase